MKVWHYRAEWWRDLIPRMDRVGAKREKDTIIDLKSHAEAGTWDHDFMSPTYADRLQDHIEVYILSKGERI